MIICKLVDRGPSNETEAVPPEDRAGELDRSILRIPAGAVDYQQGQSDVDCEQPRLQWICEDRLDQVLHAREPYTVTIAQRLIQRSAALQLLTQPWQRAG
jgi:hypothetical protein